ncbi:hypothetical protein E2C01_090303 [Portunus trituberculatus]|uniref:Uncharacterized protein n=1 Tax=Portunus trituberculatus TaxID=210409 RepID=A0A5B7JPR5_PORTR|nr:hypothetical protein [Portunus trituberculatus]
MWRVCVPPTRSTGRAPHTSLLSSSRGPRLTPTARGRLTRRITSLFRSPGRRPSSVLLCRDTLGFGTT